MVISQEKPRPAIQIHQVTKRFGEVQALAGLDLELQEGELFGLLGPNGAGKTTTIRILTGLARPDAGTIHISGIDCSERPQAAQHLLGVVPDASNLYPELTGFENLCFCGALYGIRRREREHRARALLERLGLETAADRKFAGYSRGMKRRLTIAAGIIHTPPILFLDEPTTGLDVAAARQIRQQIAELNADGTTILLTTHYIEEAERLCGRIGLLVAGRLVRVDTVDALMGEFLDRHAVSIGVAGDGAGPCAALTAGFPALRCQVASHSEIHVESSAPIHVGELVSFLHDHGAEVSEARALRPSLEEVFVRITGIEVAAMRRDRPQAKGGGAA